jgi:hypothetical protein
MPIPAETAGVREVFDQDVRRGAVSANAMVGSSAAPRAALVVPRLARASLVAVARLKPDWKDMSEYLVHFTEEQPSLPPLPDDAHPRAKLFHNVRRHRTPYNNWTSFLWDGHLKPSERRFGVAKNEVRLAASQRAVCFSEVPLQFVRRIAERRENRYGIGFTKEFARKQGTAPVWYLDKDQALAEAFNAVYEAHMRNYDPDDPFWKLTAHVDRPGTYPTRYGLRDYRFEWEREWRVAGPDGFRFAPGDVALLFLPAEEHDVARQWFADHEADNTGPAYFCPYIDPFWDDATIHNALANPPPKPPGRRTTPW